MKFVNVREFKLRATQILKANQEVVITRYGKPIARLVPETEETIADLVREIGRIFKAAGITKQEALKALEEVRREIYGPRRRVNGARRRTAAA